MTLIELVVVIVIIGAAGSSVTGILTLFSAHSAEAMMRSQAVSVASAYLDEVLQKPFLDPQLPDGEVQRDKLDDVHDYNINDPVPTDRLNTQITLPQYKVSVQVNHDGSLGLPAVDVYRVDVEVFDQSGNVLATLTGYRTRHE
jgi:MSHA pilin protein MshD